MSPRHPSLMDPPIAFAHRGARANAPENTIEAFELAVRLGASGLESDIWLTRDGVAVLDHDGVVGHRPRRKRIADLDRAQLPEHIPTFEDLYGAIGPALPVSLDLKDEAAIHEVLRVARDHDAEEGLWLCHPDLDVVASWRELSATARLVHSTWLEHMPRGPEQHAASLARLGVDAVNLHRSQWTGGYVVLYHRFGRYALGWDAQFERVIRELVDAGIDGVFSDHVDRLTSVLG